MAQATDDQVKALETALTQQFFNLVQGARFRIALARQYGLDSVAFKKYNASYIPFVNKWVQREVKYERELLKSGVKGIIASGNLKYADFFASASLPKLDEIIKKFDADKSTNGIGFIPVLIWAIVAIAGFFTAKEITDDLTTTTQEKEQLMQVTKQTAIDLGLTPEQTAAMISQTQAEASSGTGLGDIVKYGIAAVLLIFGISQFTKTKTA